MKPPSSAAAALSGCPSSSRRQRRTRRRRPVARAPRAARGRRRDPRRSAAAEEPRPRPCGIALTAAEPQAPGWHARRARGRRARDRTTRWSLVARHLAGALAGHVDPRAPGSAARRLDGHHVVQRQRETEAVEARARGWRWWPARRTRTERTPSTPSSRPTVGRRCASRLTSSPRAPARRDGVHGHPHGLDLGAVRAAQRPLRVLEAVAGDRADDRRARGRAGRRRARRAGPRRDGRRGRLDEHALRTRTAAGARARICSSVTASIRPPDSSRAATACRQEAGLPIRIAVAMVSGVSTGCPRTIGAAPAAWKPHIRGRCVAGRAAPAAGVLAVALPVGGDVAGVADRQAVDVGSVAERVDDLEGGASSGPRCGPG